jgi:hypothetical protein
MKLVIGSAAVLIVACAPLWAKPRPATSDPPNTAEWRDISQSMAELVEQGFSLIEAMTAGQQDEITIYFLSKGTELVKCRDGVLLTNNRAFVSTCAKLVRPFQAKQ